jgi:hypothetical protein
MIGDRENKIQVPFYPLTEEGLKDWYRKKYITASGYILGILRVTRPPGAVLSIPDVTKFCREWQISRSAFYKAISALKVNGDIEWEAIAGVKLRVPEKTVFFERKSVSNRGQMSPIMDTESPIVDTESPIVDTESPIVDTSRSKPLPDKASSPPQTIQTYSDFIQTLSNSERENFLEFGLKKANQLPQPPELPLKWVERHWEEVRSQWEKTEAGRAVASSQVDWTQHPNWSEWLDFMRNRGVPTFVALGEWLDRKTRREIADWADERNLIWGAES